MKLKWIKQGITVTDEQLTELLTLRCVVDSEGTRVYRNAAGRVHRIHGPAIIWPDGSNEWMQNGRHHCQSGPAVTRTSGLKFWFLDGHPMTQSEWQLKCVDSHG